MLTGTIDLAFNVGHALWMSPPDYVRSVLGDVDAWWSRTCPPTELQLAEVREWKKGFPALAHILIPAVPFRPPLAFPLSDLLFRPSVIFQYPPHANTPSLTPREMWFFINGICTDRSVVNLNARYLHRLFKRPLTVLHNFTRGWAFDLAACAIGKEWDQVTESAAIAFPAVYGALKNPGCERVILLAHSQGTILSAVILELLKGLHPPLHKRWMEGPPAAPEHAVARRLAKRWHFSRTIRTKRAAIEMDASTLPSFEWPGHGLRQPEPVTKQDLARMEIYCFANCATRMLPVTDHGFPRPWIESYGNEKDIVARLGVLANTSGPGRVRIGGDRYRRDGAWGHLLNAHYLYPMMSSLSLGDQRGGLAPLPGNRFQVPRLFEYLGGNSPTGV
jgi:hypothetical protein